MYSVVVNKVDRLILELRLPPGDAYFKLRQTIEEVNTVISCVLPLSSHRLIETGADVNRECSHSEIDPDPSLRVSPEKGNVAFASTQMGWCFTLKSFAKMYSDTFGQFPPLTSPFSLFAS